MALSYFIWCCFKFQFVLVSDLKTGKFAREMPHLIQQCVVRLFGSKFFLNPNEIICVILTFMFKIILGLFSILHLMEDYKKGKLMLRCMEGSEQLKNQILCINLSAAHLITTK